MHYQAVFKRWELKYILTEQQAQRIEQLLGEYLQPDRYGQTTVRTLYFDTPDYRIIRRSLDKPVYKEKLRLRSYRQVGAQEAVFVELKKKYKGVVYKRRLSLPEQAAMAWLDGGTPPEDGQIVREINYFCSCYPGLRPSVYLSCDRTAYTDGKEGGLRVTFDRNIYFREDRLSLQETPGGTAILPESMVLLEIKTPNSIPLWLTGALTRERVFKTSFSKYGTAYTKFILKGNYHYA